MIKLINELKIKIEDFTIQIEKNTVLDILTILSYADFTKSCEYKNLTSEEVVKKYCDLIDEIAKRYKVDLKYIDY